MLKAVGSYTSAKNRGNTIDPLQHERMRAIVKPIVGANRRGLRLESDIRA